MPKTSKTVFSTEWFNVDEIITDKSIKPYYKIVVEDGVIILAITMDNKLILVRQFRPALEEYTLEFPSGGIEKNEKPLDAAKRELYEETGYRCSKFKAVGKNLDPMSNRISGKFFLFVGFHAEKDNNFIHTEDIEVLTVNKSKFMNLVNKGDFNQISAIAAFALGQWNKYI